VPIEIAKEPCGGPGCLPVIVAAILMVVTLLALAECRTKILGCLAFSPCVLTVSERMDLWRMARNTQ